MDFGEIWEKHSKWIIGGGAALALLAFVVLRRTAAPTTVETVVPQTGGGDNGETAAAISDLGAALGQQSDSFSSALGQMAQGQQAYFASFAEMLNSQDHQSTYDNPAASTTSVTYIMPNPPPVAAASESPQSPVPTSLDQMAYTYGNNEVYQGEAQANHAAADEVRLKSDPAFRQSEIDRALKVIQFRKDKGLATSDQDAYLKSLMGN